MCSSKYLVLLPIIFTEPCRRYVYPAVLLSKCVLDAYNLLHIRLAQILLLDHSNTYLDPPLPTRVCGTDNAGLANLLSFDRRGSNSCTLHRKCVYQETSSVLIPRVVNNNQETCTKAKVLRRKILSFTLRAFIANGHYSALWQSLACLAQSPFD